MCLCSSLLLNIVLVLKICVCNMKGKKKKRPKDCKVREFLCGPVAKTLLPKQGARVQSLVRELDPTCHN